jgi:zinc protease
MPMTPGVTLESSLDRAARDPGRPFGDVVRTEIEGVPVFWAETPGPFTAGLIFRVGTADEPAPSRGITHMVEHLALPAGPVSGIDFNGTVSPIHTWFWAAGERDAVLDFLRATAASMRSLPDRLVTEREILLTEEARRGGSAGTTASSLRFGPRGHGLVGYKEWGLRWLGLDEASAWSEEMLNRGNAAVWMTGPPPDALGLDLPAGSGHPAPALTPVADVRYPCVFPQAGPGGVAVSMLMDRTWAGAIAGNVAVTRLRARLRQELGLSYSVDVAWEPLSADVAHVVLASDCRAGSERDTATTMRAVLEQLAADGATQVELDHENSERRRYAADGSSLSGALFTSAANELLGKPFESLTAGLEHAAAVTPAAVAESMQRAVSETAMLLMDDPGLQGLEGWEVYPLYSGDVVEGRTLKPSAGGPQRLVAGEDGLMIVNPNQEPVTVRFGDCEVVERWPDGMRILYGSDATLLPVEATMWTGGSELVQALDADLEAISVAMNEPLEAQVAALRADLQRDRSWKTNMDRNLTAAVRVMGYGEDLVDAVTCKWGQYVGVLVLTSRRLLVAAGFQARLELPLETIESVNPQGLRWPNTTRVRVTTSERTYDFYDVAPRGRVQSFLDSLDAAAEGRAQTKAVGKSLGWHADWMAYIPGLTPFISLLGFMAGALVPADTHAGLIAGTALVLLLGGGTCLFGFWLSRRQREHARWNGGPALGRGWTIANGVVAGLYVLLALLVATSSW